MDRQTPMSEEERLRRNIQSAQPVQAPTQPPMQPPIQPERPGAIHVGGAGGVLDQMGAPQVGEKEIIKANTTLMKYKGGKVNLEARVVANEQWWKRRHWEYMEGGNENDRKPASAWLFNCIMSKQADAIEAFPEPNILPREEGDKDEAKKLSAIVPVILKQNDYEQTYADTTGWQKLKQGTGIYGVFWDRDKLNGLGDVAVRKIDVLNIFWEPGITDIQRSKNIFTVELVDRDDLREMYPQLGDKQITGNVLTPDKYIYDDSVDTTDKAVVVDWYYHKRVGGRRVLHYVKYVDTTVLYATENDPQWRDRGLYDHGMYPFVFDPLFPVEGSPCGYGYIDIGKDAQARIDFLNQVIDKNAIMNAQPRHFIRGDGQVNEAEFADWTKPFVHVQNSQLGEDSIRKIEPPDLNANVVTVLNNLILELKETTGNRDVNNGGSQSGVTAASAIAALQEQSGKTSRASNMSAYRAFERVCTLIIELIRQFYDMPRQFRITGDNGMDEFVSLDNSGIQPQPLQYGGVDMGMRLPVFDIDISAQRMSAYTKVTQNELALQLYQMGVLDPQNADKALALLDIMDFNHKDLIEGKIRQNGTMYELLTFYQQTALTLAMQAGNGQAVQAISQNIMATQQGLSGGIPTTPPTAQIAASPVSGVQKAEPKIVANARAQAQGATQPNT